MTHLTGAREVRKFKDIFLDMLYLFFKPVWDFLLGPVYRQYRVKYTYDGGMTKLSGDETFTAMHDRQARRLARRIADTDFFELEEYRPVKRK